MKQREKTFIFREDINLVPFSDEDPEAVGLIYTENPCCPGRPVVILKTDGKLSAWCACGKCGAVLHRSIDAALSHFRNSCRDEEDLPAQELTRELPGILESIKDLASEAQDITDVIMPHNNPEAEY